MVYVLLGAAGAAVLFLGVVAALETGRSLGIRHRSAGIEAGGTGALDAAVFALLGLLIAFTFSGAAQRFTARRDLIVQETNNIGTAYLRVDLLPADRQPVMRELFRKYVDTRLAIYRKLPDLDAAWADVDRANGLQAEIWKLAVAGTQAPGLTTAPAMLLLPALNSMFDISTTRTMAAQMHPPTIVFGMLFLMALSAALLAGYAMAGGRQRQWLHIVVFAAVMALVVYVIIDLEFPRLGLIQVSDFDQALIALRSKM